MMSPISVAEVVLWAATRALRPERMMVAARILAIMFVCLLIWWLLGMGKLGILIEADLMLVKIDVDAEATDCGEVSVVMERRYGAVAPVFLSTANRAYKSLGRNTHDRKRNHAFLSLAASQDVYLTNAGVSCSPPFLEWQASTWNLENHCPIFCR